MIFDQFGRPIREVTPRAPRPGAQIFADPVSDRESLDVSRRLTPREVDRIMIAANGGDVEAQCRLARELPEKSHDIRHALSTRRNALSGCKYSILPGDDTPQAKVIAEALEQRLGAAGGDYPEIGRLLSFRRLLRSLSDAILPGFALAETIWRPGGTGFYGWRTVDQRFVTFTRGFSPRLRVTGNYDGIPLPPGKVVYHETAENGDDPARGGLIRPLAWLYCFANLNIKDLLSFIERYGMPFVVAKIDKATYDSEGAAIRAAILNFGPDGGGVFSRAVEFELLQAANNTGDVYFKLLTYLGDAIAKVLIGQTASSGDASGLSGGDAQSQVRQDILEADARALEETVNRDLFAPWVAYNYPPGAPVPLLSIDTAEAEDTATLATTLKTLYEAGFEASDEAEVSERIGIQLRRRPPEPAAASPAGLELAESEPPDALQTWLGPVAAEIAQLAECEDAAEFGDRLAALAEGGKFGDAGEFEAALAGLIAEAIRAGKIASQKRSAKKR